MDTIRTAISWSNSITFLPGHLSNKCSNNRILLDFLWTISFTLVTLSASKQAGSCFHIMIHNSGANLSDVFGRKSMRFNLEAEYVTSHGRR